MLGNLFRGIESSSGETKNKLTSENIREKVISIIGPKPDRSEYESDGGFDDATSEYWDKYWSMYDKIYMENQGKEEEKKIPQFFRSKESRKDVYKICKAITEYLVNNNIQNLIIPDRSSRPLYIGVIEYWKSKFPEKKMPGMYFVNPKGFKNTDKLSRWELAHANDEAYVKGDLDENLSRVRNEEEVMEEFKDVYSKLYSDKDKPLLIFDTCIHSGDTLKSVVDVFDNLGFTDVRVGSVNPSDPQSKVKSDFFVTTQRPEQGCYPFDRDRMIEKTFEHVYSRRSGDSKKRELGIALRKEIKKIMQENL